MNVFATSWRNSLAAMALGALVTTAPNPAAAQDRDPPPRDRERSERGVRDDDNPARPAAPERGRRDREAARQVGDRPGPREQGMREQRELEELSRRLRAELNQLGDDQAEEAEEIELRLRDIKEKIEVMEHRRQDEAARDRPDRPASDLAPRRELDRLEDRADDLRRDLANARREASSPERKESLERELQAIQGRIAEIRRRFGGDRPGPRRSVLDPLRDDRGAGPAVESYLAAVRRLRQFAPPEEGQRLAQQAMEIARRLRHRPDPPRLAETPRYPQPPRPQIAPPRDGAADQLRGQLEGRVREALEEARGQTEEMRQQLDETRRAIEETRHGVLEEIHGQTAPVRREIDEMHGALEETHGRMAQMGRELDEQVHGAMEETHGQIERMNREITQMRGALEEARRQMEEMRRQMEEMRGAMHRMTQPPQRDPGPRDEDAPNPFQP